MSAAPDVSGARCRRRPRRGWDARVDRGAGPSGRAPVSVLIRTVVDDDLAAIGALHRRSRCAAYAGLVSAAALAAGSEEAMGEWWTERWRWERDTHRLAVAEVAGAVAGFSYVGPSESPGAVELYAIHVDPALVGTGIGRALMISALHDLAAVAALPDASWPAVDRPAVDRPAVGPAAVDRAVLWVLTGNTRAQRFYVNGGWVADGERRDSPIGPELVTQLRYARPLPFSAP